MDATIEFTKFNLIILMQKYCQKYIRLSKETLRLYLFKGAVLFYLKLYIFKVWTGVKNHFKEH